MRSMSVICASRRSWRPPSNGVCSHSVRISSARPGRRCARPSTARWRRCARATGGRCTGRCTARPGRRGPCWRRSARPGPTRRARCPRSASPAATRRGRRPRRSAGSRPRRRRRRCPGRRPRGPARPGVSTRCAFSVKPAWSEPMAMRTSSLLVAGRRRCRPAGGRYPGAATLPSPTSSVTNRPGGRRARRRSPRTRTRRAADRVGDVVVGVVAHQVGHHRGPCHPRQPRGDGLAAAAGRRPSRPGARAP